MTDTRIPSIETKEIDMEKCYFNPGCAMSLYLPELPRQMMQLLCDHFGPVKPHTLCCHHDPGLPPGSTIINNCAGCDRRFRSQYQGIQTISYWEILASLEGLGLPDYKGLTVSVHDSCSFRQKPQVHAAVRKLLEKMKIKVTESPYSGTKSICCGDNFYGHIPSQQVIRLQKKRASQMPCQDVVVYCIGCVHSMTAGGKKARYLPDLLFGRETQPPRDTLEQYHRAVEAYIEDH